MVVVVGAQVKGLAQPEFIPMAREIRARHDIAPAMGQRPPVPTGAPLRPRGRERRRRTPPIEHVPSIMARAAFDRWRGRQLRDGVDLDPLPNTRHLQISCQALKPTTRKERPQPVATLELADVLSLRGTSRRVGQRPAERR
jgi:hypothetical protein